MRAMEEVITKDEGAAIIAKEILADQESIHDASWNVLDSIGDLHAELAAIAKQHLEAIVIAGIGDDHDFVDASLHQSRKRIIDHRLIVDRGEQFVVRGSDRVEPRAIASAEDDTFHEGVSFRGSLSFYSCWQQKSTP